MLSVTPIARSFIASTLAPYEVELARADRCPLQNSLFHTLCDTAQFFHRLLSKRPVSHPIVGFALAVRSTLQEYLQQVNLLRHFPSSGTCLSAKARTLFLLSVFFHAIIGYANNLSNCCEVYCVCL